MTRRRIHLCAPLLLSVLVLAGCAGERAPDAADANAMRDDTSALAPDAAWMAMLARHDAAGAGTLLDADFEWTDTAGLTRNREASIAALAELAASLRDDTDVQSYHYGHVDVVTSARPGARMMRVWTRRPEGWRVLAVIGTALVTGTTPFAAAADVAAADCDNPCRSMPYTPTTDNARTIADLFMQLKMDEWHPDPVRWAPYVLDGVYYTTATAQLSKEARVEYLTRLKETGAPTVPGDPVVSMRIVDAGDAAVMVARHAPYRGGQPYHSVRVWAFRDGRWQLANTQQTVIADAPASPPVVAGP